MLVQFEFFRQITSEFTQNKFHFLNSNSKYT